MKHLLVAKYKEDTSWTEDVSDEWKVTIITNGVDRPNEGREAGIYLWWLAKEYKNIDPDGLYAFVQGNPFPHCEDLYDRLGQEPLQFTPMGNLRCITDGQGMWHHPGLPVKERFEEWVGMEFPGEVEFTAGAQFIVPGNLILKHPKFFYKKLEKQMSEGENPWSIERIWAYIFGQVL